MNAIADREVNSSFKINDKTYQVVPTATLSCKGCAFAEMRCSYLPTGRCGVGRTDNTPVIFVQTDPPVAPKQPKPAKSRRRR